MADRARRVLQRAGLALGVALALPAVAYAFPWLVGGTHAFVVLSGSMEPALHTGDLIVVAAPRDVRPGDVVTARPDPRLDVLVTHRVVEVGHAGGVATYRTKGDANDAPDSWTLTQDQLVGEYAWRVPYWGLLLHALRSPVGYVALVLVPGLAIIGGEFAKLYRELDARDRARRAPAADDLDAFLAGLELDLYVRGRDG